ncbi:MAG: N-formylglutamate deformylase [Beijerinckiaceae bacterium]
METFTFTRGESPLILSMPHPGTAVPPDVGASLNDRGRLVEDTDWHMRELYRPIENRFRPTVIEATLSRYVIDLNRDPSGVSLYPGQATTELVPTMTFDGAPIWQVPPDAAEIARRKALYFQPYHAALAAEIARVKAKHGYCVLWDCHSIKSIIPRLFDGKLPMMNLGTNSGASCAVGVQVAAELAMAASGLAHVSNGRFKGGWITRHYGTPSERIHAIQMELGLDGYLASEAPPWTFAPDIARPLQRALEHVIAAALDAAGEAP